jgi:hypothetical protein
MILSFGWTAAYLPPEGTKDTTRRIWKPRTFKSWQNAYDAGRLTHVAVNKCLAFGGERIGTITLIERPFLQLLSDMPAADLVREGGMCQTVDEFIHKYFGGNYQQQTTVVRFTYQPLES